jgi:LAO/AO transport system kinase
VDAVWQMIEAFHGESAAAGRVADRRAAQNAAWMERLVREMIEQKLARNPQLSGLLPELRSAVAAGTLSPLTAARQIVEKL